MVFLLLLLGLGATLLALVAVRRRSMWAPAMVGSELATWLAAGSLVLLGVFGLFGAVRGFAGILGAVLIVGAAVGFVIAAGRTLNAPDAAARAVSEFVGSEIRPPRWALLGLVVPIAFKPRRLIVDEGLRYGHSARHRLDHLRIAGSGERPALIYVHGGGWLRGRRHTQARPMLYRLAAAGWHVFTPSYRLSPEATFPEHLVDIKRAIAWVRSNAEHLGVDTDAIAIAGGSSGGNLAALAALTENEPELQPGFETIDTSLMACVPLYGVHDMLRPNGSPLWPYLATTILKSTPDEDPDAWRAASPVRMATEDRPAFFVVHGGNDTLVRVDQSRRLVKALKAAGGPVVGYLEVPDANHGYDFFAGVRGRATAAAVVEALQYVHDRWRVE